MFMSIPFILILFSPSEGKPVKDGKTVVVKEYQDCGIVLPFVQGIKIKVLGRGKLGMYGDLNVTEDVGNITQLEVRVQRCKSAADMESCEYFTSGKYNNPCPMIMARGQMWSAPFEHVTPRFVCPVKKGQYVVKDATLDSSTFASFPGLEGWYWRPKVKIYKGDTLVACFKVGISIEQIRMRGS